MSKDPASLPKRAGQLSLPVLSDEESLRSSLSSLAGKELALALTDNRTVMLSVRREQGGMRVRLHRIFLRAEENVIAAVADFIRGCRAGQGLIRRFVRDNSHCLGDKPLNSRTNRTAGAFHCLKTAFDRINAEYFEGSVTSSITWGRRCSRRRPRRVTLGSFSRDSNTIRINPMLDRKGVPAFFVEYIVYHEMLHAAMEPGTKKKRRSVHPPEFRRRERQFLKYNEAICWEKEQFSG